MVLFILLILSLLSISYGQNIVILNRTLPAQQAFFYRPYDIITQSKLNEYLQTNTNNQFDKIYTLRFITANEILLDDKNPIPQTVNFCRYNGSSALNGTIALLDKNICQGFKRSSLLISDLYNSNYAGIIMESLQYFNESIIVGRVIDHSLETNPLPLPIWLLNSDSFQYLQPNISVSANFIDDIDTSLFNQDKCTMSAVCLISIILFSLIILYTLVLSYLLIMVLINQSRSGAIYYWLLVTLIILLAAILRLISNGAECNLYYWPGYVLLHISNILLILAYAITLTSWIRAVNINIISAKLSLIIIGFITLFLIILAAIHSVAFLWDIDTELVAVETSFACLISIGMIIISGRNYLFLRKSTTSTTRKGKLHRRILVPFFLSLIVTILVVILTGLSLSSNTNQCAKIIVSLLLYLIISLWLASFIVWIYINYIHNDITNNSTTNINRTRTENINNSNEHRENKSTSQIDSNNDYQLPE